MGKLKHCPTNFLQLIGGAHMGDLNMQLKKWYVTFGHAPLSPPCLKEQACCFLLLSTAAKLQIQLCPFLTFGMLQIVSCLSPTCPASSFYDHTCSGCPKMDLSLSCSTSFIAISSCSSCHLYSLLCIYFTDFFISDWIWTNTSVEFISLYSSVSLGFNIIFQTLQSTLENIN